MPIALLRKQYGRSVMGEVLERAVNQGSQQAIAEHELRPALRPKIEVTSFDEGADLEFTMALEVLPEVPKSISKRSSWSARSPRSARRRWPARSKTSPATCRSTKRRPSRAQAGLAIG